MTLTDQPDRAFRSSDSSGRPSRTIRWARIALAVGALLLSAAVGLIVWDAAASDPPPAVITGRNG